jgi:hypothetical protein
MSLRLCGLLLCPMLLLGCDQRPREPASPEELKGRLDAALSMRNVADRNDALASVARDAAAAGDGDMVKRALGPINNTSRKDEAAAACALKLAEIGKSQVAVEVAKTIHNSPLQNETLGRIAKGDR